MCLLLLFNNFLGDMKKYLVWGGLLSFLATSCVFAYNLSSVGGNDQFTLNLFQTGGTPASNNTLNLPSVGGEFWFQIEAIYDGDFFNQIHIDFSDLNLVADGFNIE